MQSGDTTKCHVGNKFARMLSVPGSPQGPRRRGLPPFLPRAIVGGIDP
jgi:hypothetical protein